VVPPARLRPDPDHRAPWRPAGGAVVVVLVEVVVGSWVVDMAAPGAGCRQAGSMLRSSSDASMSRLPSASKEAGAHAASRSEPSAAETFTWRNAISAPSAPSVKEWCPGP